ncbi:MAG: hypothetical protein R2690_20860 [Acidimicrobiales bacterium]
MHTTTATTTTGPHTTTETEITTTEIDRAGGRLAASATGANPAAAAERCWALRLGAGPPPPPPCRWRPPAPAPTLCRLRCRRRRLRRDGRPAPNLALGDAPNVNTGDIWGVQSTSGDVWADVSFVANRPNLVVQFSTTKPTMVNGKLSVGAVAPTALNGTLTSTPGQYHHQS